jgi:hypothetical protein
VTPHPIVEPTTDTVSDADCPVAHVEHVSIISTDGNAYAYPVCMQPPASNAVWACIHYLPDARWSTVTMGTPTGPTCGSDGLGDVGRVDPDAVTS